MILRIARFASPAVFLLSLAACQPSAQPATDAGAAEVAADVSAPVAMPSDPGSPVAGLKALASTGGHVEASQVAAYLERHFKGQCVDGDPRLSFERVCQHYPLQAAKDDPSPWPDLVLGIDEGRVVSAAILGAAEAPGAGWQCVSAMDLDGMRFCYVETVPEADRIRWSAEWTAYFGSGD